VGPGPGLEGLPVSRTGSLCVPPPMTETIGQTRIIGTIPLARDVLVDSGGPDVSGDCCGEAPATADRSAGVDWGSSCFSKSSKAAWVGSASGGRIVGPKGVSEIRFPQRVRA